MSKFISILALGCILLCACYNSSFAPATSTVYPQTQELATVIYKNDLHKFDQCEVIELGNVHVGGNSFVGHGDLLNHAREIAAKRGATHLYILETHTDYRTTYNTSCYGGNNNVNCTTSSTNYPKPQGTYLALRITCPSQTVEAAPGPVPAASSGLIINNPFGN